jgi:hypothetical protein
MTVQMTPNWVIIIPTGMNRTKNKKTDGEHQEAQNGPFPARSNPIMSKSQSGLSSVTAPPLDLSSVYTPKTGRIVLPQQNKQQEDVNMDGDNDATDGNDKEDGAGGEGRDASEAATEPEVWHEVARTRDRFFTAFVRETALQHSCSLGSDQRGKGNLPVA